MEGEVMTNSGAGGNIPASPRWNPTKEQISMLENWYKQGIRTPTADQIQQITARLQAYGHIEGKNVFYWFQNHKARQRQKQKQESLAFFSRCFHKTNSPPAFPPPPPNVVCSPYYPAQSEFGFYPPHYPKMLLQGGIKKKSKPDTSMEMLQTSSSAGCESTHLGYSTISSRTENNNVRQETLSLFPLEPTGVLQKRTSSSASSSSSSAVIPTADPSSSSSGINGESEIANPTLIFSLGVID